MHLYIQIVTIESFVHIQKHINILAANAVRWKLCIKGVISITHDVNDSL